jgi:hypothetical protein
VRARALCAAAAALVATALLAGCRSNVGVAARVDGHRITESRLSSYITARSQPIPAQLAGQHHAVPPKPFVLSILINKQYYRKLLVNTPGGLPTQGQISSIVNGYLRGRTPLRALEQLGVHGYTAAFAQQVLVYSAMGLLLNRRLRSGVHIGAVAKKLSFPVSVNPRYGVWKAKQHLLASGPGAGLPAFLKMQSTRITG